MQSYISACGIVQPLHKTSNVNTRIPENGAHCMQLSARWSCQTQTAFSDGKMNDNCNTIVTLISEHRFMSTQLP